MKTSSGFEDTLTDCYTVAGIYQLAVEQLGEDAFKAAQEAAARGE